MDKPTTKKQTKRKDTAKRIIDGSMQDGNEVIAEIYKDSDGVVSKGGSVTVRNPHGYEPTAI